MCVWWWAFAKCPLFRNRERRCHSLTFLILCRSIFALHWKLNVHHASASLPHLCVQCACAYTLLVHLSLRSFIIAIVTVLLLCRCSSLLSTHRHYPTESSINKCVCALSSSSSFWHLHHSTTFVTVSIVSAFATAISTFSSVSYAMCVPSSIEWRSISIRMANYLTLKFMRHWLIENWHMYTHTLPFNLQSCNRVNETKNGERVLHVLNYKDAIYIGLTICSSLGRTHTHTQNCTFHKRIYK